MTYLMILQWFVMHCLLGWRNTSGIQEHRAGGGVRAKRLESVGVQIRRAPENNRFSSEANTGCQLLRAQNIAYLTSLLVVNYDTKV